VEWDGDDVVLKTYMKLIKKRKNLWLVVIGSGDFEKEFKKAIKNENLNKIIMIGRIPHKEIHNYMMIGDIGLMPLREPQCGLGAISVELMSLGIPIIATDVGALREIIIDQRTGFIIKKNIIKEMVRKTNFLLANPDILENMRINSKIIIKQNFSNKNILSTFNLIINNYINKNKK